LFIVHVFIVLILSAYGFRPLPPMFKNAHSFLQALDLSRNLIEVVPAHAFSGLEHLRNL